MVAYFGRLINLGGIITFCFCLATAICMQRTYSDRLSFFFAVMSSLDFECTKALESFFVAFVLSITSSENDLLTWCFNHFGYVVSTLTVPNYRIPRIIVSISFSVTTPALNLYSFSTRRTHACKRRHNNTYCEFDLWIGTRVHPKSCYVVTKVPKEGFLLKLNE